MAEVAKGQPVSYVSLTPPQSATINGLLAGEALAAGDACSIRADGRVIRANGTALNAAAKVAGFAFQDASLDEAVTLVTEGNFRYAAALTIGASYYASATVPGGLSDTATTGGVNPVAFAIDATRIRIVEGGLFR